MAMAGLIKRYGATVAAAVVVAAVVAACLAFALAPARGAGRGGRLVALVHCSDGTTHALPLDTDAELHIQTEFGSNTVVVEDGAVRMREADCPHGDCLHQSAISQPGEQIICLPHRLWIEVVPVGDDEAGEMDVDAVAYGPDAVDTVAR